MATATITATVPSGDPALIEMLHRILGKQCWRVEFAYGGELHLNFGGRVPCESPGIPDRVMGAWRFNTCGTAWTLYTPEVELRSSGRDKQLLEVKINAALEGGRLVGLDVGRVTNLRFDNDCVVSVHATRADDKFPDIPYWEVFMPKHRIVTYGPGSTWRLARSDSRSKAPASAKGNRKRREV